ncbi:Aste57867_19908 [Aphanomyces stellatus]|uniref:Aste57867_19908 protein n=1 Tax=Aphanomyces stellatus TaxID=120398 RepID=A0A485LDL4_9STRA|nr:hypothetical protein As57867_019842 [Aphanomyces stellatus]VFT96606.1 Aste57867_19908 [Aphanomyces stellatus]
MSKNVPYAQEDRQWDARFNVPTDDDVVNLVTRVMEMGASGKYKYLLVSGVEVGTRPQNGDYRLRHVHMCIITYNKISKGAILKALDFKEGQGYYLSPQFSKEDTSKLSLYEHGELPRDVGVKRTGPPVMRTDMEKKMKTDDICREIKRLLELGTKDAKEEAFTKYPRMYITYGEKIKALLLQRADRTFDPRMDPHLYVMGPPGSGKTSLMSLIYPGAYKKDLSSRFWDLYDPDSHTHTILEDLDMDNVEKLTVQFLKTISDEAGFPIDQKYKTPQLARTTVLVTSQYSIDQLINPENTSDCEGSKRALKPRFFCFQVWDLHRLLGIKLLPKYEIKMLQKEGNQDPARLYMAYNYNLDCPTGEALPTPLEMQLKIRNYVFG